MGNEEDVLGRSDGLLYLTSDSEHTKYENYEITKGETCEKFQYGDLSLYSTCFSVSRGVTLSPKHLGTHQVLRC